MPTDHPRIAITRDPELDAALDRAAALLGRGVPVARLVRDLALRGARSLEGEDAERRAPSAGAGVRRADRERAPAVGSKDPRPDRGPLRVSGPFGGRQFIADASAHHRAGDERVRDQWIAAYERGLLLTCLVVRFELLYSARGIHEFDDIDSNLTDLRGSDHSLGPTRGPSRDARAGRARPAPRDAERPADRRRCARGRRRRPSL